MRRAVDTITVTPPRDKRDRAQAGDGAPGVVIVFAEGRATAHPIPLPPEPLELGRATLDAVGFRDSLASRRNAAIRREGDVYYARDLDSTNGTFVNGVRIRGEVVVGPPGLIRVGSTLVLLTRDVERFAGLGVEVGDAVAGPALLAARATVRLFAKTSRTLLVTGETGVGKELAAGWFHAALATDASPRKAMVPVNCAGIPRELAERLLFGAVRGAYSGSVADSTGYAQAADGGTLFLDELGELDLGTQAKLLRLLESGEATPIGASRPRTVDLRIVAATHRDLEADVVSGRFREDLYHRIGQPVVRLPPLRERLEEIPFLVELALKDRPVDAPNLGQRVDVVEWAMLERWPGNVRELLRTLGSAMSLPRLSQKPPSRSLSGPPGKAVAARAGGTSLEGPEVEEALRIAGGKVAQAAARLGVSRGKLRRFLERRGDGDGDGGTE